MEAQIFNLGIYVCVCVCTHAYTHTFSHKYMKHIFLLIQSAVFQ